MGLARDLTMGPKRPRNTPGSTGAYAKLRRLTGNPDTDPADLLAQIRIVGAQPGRMRPAEGRAYNEACSRYKALTGETAGPETDTW